MDNTSENLVTPELLNKMMTILLARVEQIYVASYRSSNGKLESLLMSSDVIFCSEEDVQQISPSADSISLAPTVNDPNFVINIGLLPESYDVDFPLRDIKIKVTSTFWTTTISANDLDDSASTFVLTILSMIYTKVSKKYGLTEDSERLKNTVLALIDYM